MICKSPHSDTFVILRLSPELPKAQSVIGSLIVTVFSPVVAYTCVLRLLTVPSPQSTSGPADIGSTIVLVAEPAFSVSHVLTKEPDASDRAPSSINDRLVFTQVGSCPLTPALIIMI